MTFPLGGGINGLAAEEVRPIWTDDYPADPRIPHEPGRRRGGRAARSAGDGRRAAPGAGRRGDRDARRSRTPTPREIAARRARPPPGPRRPGRDRARPTRTSTSCSASPSRATATSSRTRRTSSGRSTPDARFTFVSDTCRAADRLAARGAARQALRGARPRVVARGRRDRLDRRARRRHRSDRELRGRVNLLHRDGTRSRPSSSRSPRATRTAGSPARTAPSAT